MDRLGQIQHLISQGRFDESVTLAQSVANDEPANGQAWKFLSYGLATQKKWVEAKQAALQANDILPNDADILYTLGFACLNLNEFDQSLRYMEQTLQFNHNHTSARQAKHKAMFEIGKARFDRDPMASEQMLEQLLRFDPNNLEVMSLLMRLYEKSDKKVKLANLIREMSHGQALNPPLSIEIERMSLDPMLGPTVKNAMIAHRGNNAQTLANQSSIQGQNPAPVNNGFIPCPSCGNRIVDFSVTCPYCKTKLKQSRSTGQATGQGREWQSTTLTVMAVLYLLLSIAGLVSSLQSGAFRITSEILGIIVSIGIIIREETLMSVAKWVLGIRTVFGVIALLLSIASGIGWLIALMSALVAVSAFLLYLINYESQY